MVGKKLLVADDSLTIQKVIRLALSNEGYEIKAISEGSELIQEISLFRPDAVLIDLTLPGKSAFEIKAAVNEIRDLEEVRFILMASAFEKVDEAQFKALGFHAQFTKPFDPAHLRKVLNEVLGQVTAKRMEPTSFLSAPPPPPSSTSLPPLPDLPSHPTPELDEIQKLTQSTFEMISTDAIDESWNIQEPHRTSQPQASTPPPLPEVVELDLPPAFDELDLPPLEATPPAEPPSRPEIPRYATPDAPVPAEEEGGGLVSISHEQFEQMVKHRVEEALLQMTKQLLPEITERIVKQEIHKLLQNPPGN